MDKYLASVIQAQISLIQFKELFKDYTKEEKLEDLNDLKKLIAAAVA